MSVTLRDAVLLHRNGVYYIGFRQIKLDEKTKMAFLA